MKAMPRHRSHSIEFKRQVAQEFVAGETLHRLAKRHDISRNLIRVWVAKFEAGASTWQQSSMPGRVEHFAGTPCRPSRARPREGVAKLRSSRSGIPVD